MGGRGWARGAPRPGPGPASAAPKWERGQSPGPNEKWQTAALGEGTQRYGVRDACGSQSSLGGQASTQPASSPPLGLITLPEGGLWQVDTTQLRPCRPLAMGVSRLGVWRGRSWPGCALGLGPHPPALPGLPPQPRQPSPSAGFQVHTQLRHPKEVLRETHRLRPQGECKASERHQGLPSLGRTFYPPWGPRGGDGAAPGSSHSPVTWFRWRFKHKCF